MPFVGLAFIGHDANGSVADATVATSFRIVGLGDKGLSLRPGHIRATTGLQERADQATVSVRWLTRTCWLGERR